MNSNVTVDEIVAKHKGVDKKNPYFTEYLNNHIESNPDNINSSTLMYYGTCKNRLEEFRPKVKLSEIDAEFLSDFEKYLKKEHSNSQNTIFNRLKVIRKVLRVARREGLIDKNPFEYYKIKIKPTKRDFLTLEELKELVALENLPPSYKLVRDIYVFSAMSGGLRFEDICTLSTTHIRETDGENRLDIRLG